MKIKKNIWKNISASSRTSIKVEKLEYAGDKEAPENNLKDEDVHKLATAIQGNAEFAGPLDPSVTNQVGGGVYSDSH